MKHFILTSLLISMIFSLSSQSSVWKVTGNGSTIYLAGSMHLLREQDYPIPQEFEYAYNNSTHLVFECDLSEIRSKETALKVLKEVKLPDEKTLTDILSKKTYKLLDKNCKDYAINLETMKNYRPDYIFMLLTQSSAFKNGFTKDGADFIFYNRAIADGKTVYGLETIEYQLQQFFHCADNREDEYVKYACIDFSKTKTRQQWIDLVKDWKEGNLSNLENVFAEMKKHFSYFYEAMIVARNNNWFPQIEKLLLDKTAAMVVVGGGHMCGEDGIIAYLKKQGYSVEQLILN